MALPILDGNQTATTLSTIFLSGQHIPAHTVVSLGTQAITDMRGAVSGSVVSISNFPATQTIAGTVTANVAGQYFDVATGDTAQLTNPVYFDGEIVRVSPSRPLPVALATGYGFGASVTIGNSVTIGAGTAQIGSVTASISNFPATQAISIASVTIGNSVTISSLPAISGTVTVGNTVNFLSASDSDGNLTENIALAMVQNNILGIVNAVTANTFALQGTAVTTSNFTSTTASTVLASYNATREVLSIFNEGAGNLFVCPGATCTTVQYQIRLSSGDYYEVPNHQTTITHSAVFATAGTARVTEVS